ncbi:hypothetical protein KUTeg_002257, partial [Tegillarca granosa]
MAIDRFRALATPLQYRHQKLRFLVGTLISVWLLSFLYGLRIPLIYKTGDKSHFLLIFAVPSLILGICNLIVYFKLENQKVKTTNCQHHFPRRRKAIRLLLLMMVIFIVCHLPLYSFRLYVIRSNGKVKYKGIIIQCLLILSWCNSVFNILFYGSLKDSVKNCVFDFVRK